jgi:methylated-DNA-[protein]-cysteine S-methyltransferase
MSQSTCSAVIASPIGDLLLTSNGEALTGMHMETHMDDLLPYTDHRKDDAILALARTQLREYFDGERTEFDLPLAAKGTEFQKRVWAQLRRIPYGTTISYGELARRIDQPAAVRAVGRANGQNPISVIIPCHRVIGADGSLTGFGGGLDRKRTLLELEAHVLESEVSGKLGPTCSVG